MMLTPRHACIILTIITLIIAGACFAGCTMNQTGESTLVPFLPAEQPRVLLATTTSVYDAGLLDYLEPMFEKRYNVDLLITSQGTGKAIEVATRGDCDILVVHDPDEEEAFIAGGHGINRRCFAYNSYLIVGPENDPAGIRGMRPEDAFTKLVTMRTAGTPGVSFVSRGDNSGTHSAEKNIWEAAGYNYTTDIQKSGKWYIEAGRGMGETLQIASEKQAYTLTDEGTYLACRGNLGLAPLIHEGNLLLNVYSVITVYTPNRSRDRIAIANNFTNFLLSPEIQETIGMYGKDRYGKSLFSPMRGECKMFTCDCTSAADEERPSPFS